MLGRVLKMVCMSLFFVNVFAFASNDTAQYFLPTTVGTSARMIALGNIEGFSNQANSVMENPAGLYRIRKASGSFFTTKLMDEVQYVNGAVAVRMPVGVLGLGYMGVGVNNVPYTMMENDASEIQKTGEYFGLNKSLYKIGYQVSASRYLHFGISGDYNTYQLGKVSAKGYNADVGFILDSDALDFSFVAKNVFSSMPMKYTDNSSDLVVNGIDNSSQGKQEKLPFQTSYSLRYSLDQVQLYGQLRTEGAERRFVKSAGISFNPRFLPIVHMSGGYKQTYYVRSIEAELDKEYVKGGWVVGVGLDLYNVSFDYAYEKSDAVQFDNKHYFSVGMSF